MGSPRDDQRTLVIPRSVELYDIVSQADPCEGMRSRIALYFHLGHPMGINRTDKPQHLTQGLGIFKEVLHIASLSIS